MINWKLLLSLCDGMGEGVSYRWVKCELVNGNITPLITLWMLRGQLLVAIKTEISDSIDTAPSEVEVEQTQTINEVEITFDFEIIQFTNWTI